MNVLKVYSNIGDGNEYIESLQQYQQWKVLSPGWAQLTFVPTILHKVGNLEKKIFF